MSIPAPVNVSGKNHLACKQEQDSTQILFFFIPDQNRVILQT